MLFLQILGGIFLLVLIVVAYYAWKIRRFFRKLNVGDGDFSTLTNILPAMELELEPADLSQWLKRDQLIEQENELRRLGLVHEGYYLTYTHLAEIRISLWHYKHALCCALYEGVPNGDVDNTNFSFECIVKLDDGSTLCVSNSEFALNLPRPPQHPIITTDLHSPAKMMALLKQRLPAGRKVQAINSCRHFLVDSFEEMNEWLWQEQQLRSPQVAALVEPLNINLDDTLIQSLLEHGNELRDDLRSHQVIRRFAEKSKVSAAQWEDIRERLVVVHNDMSKCSLIAAIYDMSVGLSEAQEDSLDELENSVESWQPLNKFQEIRQQLGVAQHAKRVGTLTKPVAAEIYLVNL